MAAIGLGMATLPATAFCVYATVRGAPASVWALAAPILSVTTVGGLLAAAVPFRELRSRRSREDDTAETQRMRGVGAE